MRIGLALGGGGAKGLAHILMLEAFDELSITPAVVTGTSIGAVLGMLYCAGMSAVQIRQKMLELTITRQDTLRDIVTRKSLRKWFGILDPEFNGHGLLNADGFLDYLLELVPARDFADLKIPLRVVAADFWQREECVMDNGLLKPAIKASMCLPGIFTPTVVGSKVLVDGGAVNPVPYDILPKDCTLTVAVDVMGRRSESPAGVPDLMNAVLNTFQIMQRSITREKLRAAQPDIYLEPDIIDIGMLEFHKAPDIFAQAQPAKDQLKRLLQHRIERFDVN